MSSLKSRMAAFQKAATQEYTPTKKPTTSTGRAPKKTPPRKLNTSRIQQVASIVTPDSKTKSKPKPSKIKPAMVDVKANAVSPNAVSEKAQTACITPKSADEQDWEYVNELALQYDLLKQLEVEEGKAKTKSPAAAKIPTQKHAQGDKKGIKAALEGVMGGNFTANGSFLTNEFIAEYFVDQPKFKSLTFDFSGQTKFFKRFDRKDDERRSIVAKFIAALINHPRSKEMTGLNFANALIPDDFVAELARQCIENPARGLPSLQVINLESNTLQKEGFIGLADAIENPTVWRKLQILKLENQKGAMASDAEEILGEAVLQSPSLVVVSLRIRGGLARQQVNNTTAQNVDNLRQARRKIAQKNGTLKARKRNEMEQYFDEIADNDVSITDIDLVGNIKFLGLNATERTKSGAAFASNTHVKTIKMVKLKLDDAFASAFGEALASNETLEKIVLDSNDISGTGMKALFAGLGKNSKVVEFQVRHQSKTTSSSDEEALPPLLQENKTVTKLGVDLRNQMAKMNIDRKLNENREHQRKLRAAARKK